MKAPRGLEMYRIHEGHRRGALRSRRIRRRRGEGRINVSWKRKNEEEVGRGQRSSKETKEEAAAKKRRKAPPRHGRSRLNLLGFAFRPSPPSPPRRLPKEAEREKKEGMSE